MITQYSAGLLIAFAVAAVIAPFAIAKLRKMKFGQKILEDGPTWHMSKQYTPTMGGFIFIFAALIALLAVFAIWGNTTDTLTSLVLLAFSMVFGCIGCVDDMTKIKKKQNAGLSPLQKLILQIAAAAIFVTILRGMGFIAPEIYIPFVQHIIHVSWVVYLFFAVFVVVGVVNAVNLTDGIDGLATSVTAVVTLFFLFFYQKLGGDLPVSFTVALLGGLAAFYLFNKFPAKVFMGDTGSLFLGGAVAAMAFAVNMPVVLVPVGMVYIIETMSDILQVTYFKMTKGKRIFKMAPIHHHFEMCGWSERKIVFVASAITAVLCVLTYFFA